MKTFHEYVTLLEQMPGGEAEGGGMPPGGGEDMGGMAGLGMPPGGDLGGDLGMGGMGGPPGMGGMGGMGGMDPGMGGPMGGMQQQGPQAADVKQLEPQDVWSVIGKILKNKKVGQNKGRQTNKDSLNSPKQQKQTKKRKHLLGVD